MCEQAAQQETAALSRGSWAPAMGWGCHGLSGAKLGCSAKHCHPQLPSSWRHTTCTPLHSKVADVNNSALTKTDSLLMRNLSLLERPLELPPPPPRCISHCSVGASVAAAEVENQRPPSVLPSAASTQRPLPLLTTLCILLMIHIWVYSAW